MPPATTSTSRAQHSIAKPFPNGLRCRRARPVYLMQRLGDAPAGSGDGHPQPPVASGHAESERASPAPKTVTSMNWPVVAERLPSSSSNERPLQRVLLDRLDQLGGSRNVGPRAPRPHPAPFLPPSAVTSGVRQALQSLQAQPHSRMVARSSAGRSAGHTRTQRPTPTQPGRPYFIALAQSLWCA